MHYNSFIHTNSLTLTHAHRVSDALNLIRSLNLVKPYEPVPKCESASLRQSVRRSVEIKVDDPESTSEQSVSDQGKLAYLITNSVLTQY